MCESLRICYIQRTIQTHLLKPTSAIFDMDRTGSAGYKVGKPHAQLLLNTVQDPFCDTEEAQTEVL